MHVDIFYLYVTGMKFGIRKRQYGLGVVIVIVNFGGDADGCADELWHSCSKSRADDHDVIL